VSHRDFPQKLRSKFASGSCLTYHCHRTACIPHEIGSTELLLANHLNNNENLPPLEVSPPISSHFQQVASTRTSAVVAYSDFTVSLYNYFLSKAGLFLTKLSLTTNL